jgi:hypothetical protein
MRIRSFVLNGAPSGHYSEQNDEPGGFRRKTDDLSNRLILGGESKSV